jgi:hypothetical protein
MSLKKVDAFIANLSYSAFVAFLKNASLRFVMNKYLDQEFVSSTYYPLELLVYFHFKSWWSSINVT